jgi:hypothetical protein
MSIRRSSYDAVLGIWPPPVICEVFSGTENVLLLAALGPATKQHYDRLASYHEVNPVSWTNIDA